MTAANMVLDAFHDLWQGFINRLPSLAVGLVVLAFFWLLARLIRFLVLRSVKKVKATEHASVVISRLAFTGAMVLGVFVALGVMGINPGALVASLGLVSVGIGFALKDVIENFIAGITIILQKPFVIGDAVRFGDVEGVVEDVRVRDTIICMFDGRKVFVPNRALFSGVLINSTVNRRRRLDFKVGVAYGADPARAARAAEGALRGLEGILEEPPPLVVLERLGDSSLDMRVFFWLDPTSQSPLEVKSRAISAVKAALEREGISIPYPTVTLQTGA